MEPVLSARAHWPAPAKLNLFLHITGRRDDGYHLLQTVFQFLDFGDELDFSLREDGSITHLYSLSSVPPEQDLVIRAARLLQEKGGVSQGVEIDLIKRLPMGGGLGGGSSDAATTLVALNCLWGVGMTPAELSILGLELGADVPVFVHGQSCWAEGVGEKLTPVDLPEPWFVVLKPALEVATGPVFTDPELTRDCPPITIPDFLSGRGVNVFEPVVRRRYPDIGQVIDWLDKFSPARMTGTGSCVFAQFAERGMADQVLRQAPKEWQGFIAVGRNRSPLMDRLAIEQDVQRT